MIDSSLTTAPSYKGDDEHSCDYPQAAPLIHHIVRLTFDITSTLPRGNEFPVNPGQGERECEHPRSPLRAVA
jgi:hypothetical protein